MADGTSDNHGTWEPGDLLVEKHPSRSMANTLVISPCTDTWSLVFEEPGHSFGQNTVNHSWRRNPVVISASGNSEIHAQQSLCPSAPISHCSCSRRYQPL